MRKLLVLGAVMAMAALWLPGVASAAPTPLQAAVAGAQTTVNSESGQTIPLQHTMTRSNPDGTVTNVYGGAPAGATVTPGAATTKAALSKTWFVTAVTHPDGTVSTNVLRPSQMQVLQGTAPSPGIKPRATVVPEPPGSGFYCVAAPNTVDEYPPGAATPLGLDVQDVVDCSRPLLVTDNLDMYRYLVAMAGDDCTQWGEGTMFGWMTVCGVAYACHAPAPAIGPAWFGNDRVALYWNNANFTGVSNYPGGFDGPVTWPRCV